MDGDGKRLVALTHILTGMGFTEYKPGDTIPTTEPDAEAWAAAGSAMWVEADYTPPVYAKARPVTAPAGLPGIAYGGEQDGENLVGKVPNTPERRRPWKG